MIKLETGQIVCGISVEFTWKTKLIHGISVISGIFHKTFSGLSTDSRSIIHCALPT
jgi:hypothetical protein